MEILTFGSENSHGPTTLFLHGFPGMRTHQNRDLAQAVAERTKGRSIVLLYDGLGCAPGLFRFEPCFNAVHEFFRALLAEESAKGRKLKIVGHSWGGFLSLTLASQFSSAIEKLVLLSPLLSFEGAWDARVAFRETSMQYATIDFGDLDELADSFLRVGRANPIEQVVASIPPSVEVKVLQAKNDPVTPPSIAQAIMPKFKCSADLALIDNDHSFLNDRAGLADLVCAALG